MFSCSVISNSLRPRGLQHAQLPCPVSWSLLKLIESVMPSNHLILCCRLLLLPSIFSSIRVFSSESVVHIRWPKYWSFSIHPSNEYSGLFPLGLTGLISLQSNGLSRVFSSTSLKASILRRGPALTSVHDYWKNHSFDYMDLCQQSDVFAFSYAV